MNQPITLSQAMLKRLEKVSAASRCSPQTIIKQALTDKLEYEEWKLEQIDAGLADVKAGRTLSDDEFWRRLDNQRYARKKAA
jgi:predicted transcriptional regulator